MNIKHLSFEDKVRTIMENAEYTYGTENDTDEVIYIKRSLVYAFLFIFLLLMTIFLFSITNLLPDVQLFGFILLVIQSAFIAFYCGRFGAETLLLAIGKHFA